MLLVLHLKWIQIVGNKMKQYIVANNVLSLVRCIFRCTESLPQTSSPLMGRKSRSRRRWREKTRLQAPAASCNIEQGAYRN